METIDYKPRIGLTTYIASIILLLIAGGVTWYQYGSTKCIPEPVTAYVTQDRDMLIHSELKLNHPQISYHVKAGEKVTIKAYGDSHFWIETEDGTRGLLWFDQIENWKEISHSPNFEKHQYEDKNYVNIGKKQFLDKYMGRSFADNESNYWPALSRCTRGDTTFATYQMRMWEGTNAKIPTVCYVNDTAVALTSFADAPFVGNKNWLKATPWAEWIYTTPFFHVHWDDAMIERQQINLSSWPWIFRFLTNIVLFFVLMFIQWLWAWGAMGLPWMIVMWLVPLRYPFWHLSNAKLYMLLVGVALFSCYFYMPFILLNHGIITTIIIMIAVFFPMFGCSFAIIDQRCELCRCVGFIEVIEKEYDHTETTTEKSSERGEKLYTETLTETTDIKKTDWEGNESCEKKVDKTVYVTYLYYDYRLTYETDYYTHHRMCDICAEYSAHHNVEGEKRLVNKELISTHKETVVE